MSLKSILVGVVVAAFAVVSFNAMAEEKAGIGAKKAVAVQEMTLTGKIILKEDVKGEVKATDKVGKTKEEIDIKGSEKIVIKYALVEADGTEVTLPIPKARGGEKAIDLAALVGKDVKLVVKGKVKNGKKHITSIVSVTEEAAAPAAAPAEAPAAPAEAPAAPAAP